MGGVDIANQLRESYETHRKTLRVWLPLLYWLIDAIISNAYRLQYLYKKSQGVPLNHLPSQLDFRQALYKKLFAFYKQPEHQFSERLPQIRTNSIVQHVAIRQPKKSGCIWCRYLIGKRRQKIIDNTQSNEDASGRAKQTIYRCEACNVALCIKGTCWKDYHSNSN
jgi:hypothetical protein